MNLASIRIISPEIKPLVQFYEKVTNLSAKWYTEDFAEINFPHCTLAIGSTRTLSLFGKHLIQTGNSNSVIIEFCVANVDEQFENIKHLLQEIIQEPTTMPWGNRSLMFRDPDGNLINFFTPVTTDATKKHS
jgi:predicted enzyme related to lactoylglutathione lyase